MEALMVSMRLMAGVMFWAFVDLVLIVLWLAIIVGLGIVMMKGKKHD